MLTVMEWKTLKVCSSGTYTEILLSGQRNERNEMHFHLNVKSGNEPETTNKRVSWREGGLVGRKWRWRGETKHHRNHCVCAAVSVWSRAESESVLRACLPWCRRPGGAWQNTTCYPEPACLEESGWNPQLDSHGSVRQRRRQVRHGLKHTLRNPFLTFILLGYHSLNVLLFFFYTAQSNSQKITLGVRTSFLLLRRLKNMLHINCC